MTLVERARAFAIERHGEQQRKYTGEPYWYHLRNVAEMVASVGAEDETIAVAWLHDVVEDTSTLTGEIIARFGPLVGGTVYALTDEQDPALNRKARKARDRARIASSSDWVHTVKLADLIDNTSSIVQHDPEFARVYLEEKKELLFVLTRGSHDLIERAWATLIDGQRQLVQQALGGI